MTDEILGFLALIACLLWSLAVVYLMVRYNARKRKNDDWLDGDLHP